MSLLGIMKVMAFSAWSFLSYKKVIKVECGDKDFQSIMRGAIFRCHFFPCQAILISMESGSSY
jgi:hypothetical protein